MTVGSPKTFLTLPQAARELGVSWNRAWSLVLRGQLDGAEMIAGRWVVPRASVERMQEHLPPRAK